MITKRVFSVSMTLSNDADGHKFMASIYDESDCRTELKSIPFDLDGDCSSVNNSRELAVLTFSDHLATVIKDRFVNKFLEGGQAKKLNTEAFYTVAEDGRLLVK